MVSQPKKFKSFAKMFLFLLFITLPSPLIAVKQTADQNFRKEINIQKVQVSLEEDFSILPSQNTKDSLCNEDFIDNIYAQLATTQLEIFKDSTNFSSIDQYRDELKFMLKKISLIQEQLRQYIYLQIEPKPLISPTYYPYYKVDKEGRRIYTPYPKINIMSQEFMQRLQKDKELYLFIKRTETITKNTKQLQSQITSAQKQIFLQYFPDYYWIGEQYIPELYGQQTSEEILDKLDQFSVGRYRFWNIKMYRTIKSDDIKQADMLINYLEKLQENQIDNEIRIFACDLYASMLFEFQCLLNQDVVSQNEQIQQNFSLFRIIEERFFSLDNIGPIPACEVAISPQNHFIKNIIGLNLNFEYTQQEYEPIRNLLNSGLTDDFTSDYYQVARYFFDFDIFIIDFLIKRVTYHHLDIQEMKTIKILITTFLQKTGAQKEHLNKIYKITIQFLRYLVFIQNHQDLKQKMTPEGIYESIKFQYLIFTYMRMQALELGDFTQFQNWNTFIQYYIQIFKRQLKTGDDDKLIQFVGEEKYYSVIFITIEIITYILLSDDQNYLTSVYETMGSTIQHGLVIYFIEGQVSTVLQGYITRYKLITDEDFVTPRIIQRVYLEDRVEDMLLFLNDKRQNKFDSNFDQDDQEIQEFEKLSGKNKRMTKFDHLTEKRSFYKTLVQVIYNQQESQNSEELKNKIKALITQYQKNDSENANDYKKIISQIDQSQIDFVQRQQQVYYHIYLYALYEIQLIVDRQPATSAFLSFIQLYITQDDTKFSRSENTDIPEEELRTINFVFMNKVISETVDYDDKWNETLFMDSMFLYPFLYVKHKDTYFGDDSKNCENYDPVIMNLEEAEYYNISSQELEEVKSQQITHCIEQRQKSFNNLLLDEDILEGSGMTQHEFVKHLIFSPEMYLQIEQFEFMVDAFQIFNIYKKINGQRLMTDEVINDIFFSLYRFIIQIRSDPQFVYDFDFWGTINMYIQRCMSYQRFGLKNDTKYYYCAYGYERYNQMYWFIKDAQYKFTGDFDIMKMALEVNRNQNSQSINWGDRTHGRFDYFTHYLIKVKTFNNYSNSNQAMKDFNEDNNWKIEFWDECSKYAQRQSNVDYCKFLYKVGQFLDQLDDENEINDEEYSIIVNILKDNLYDDNDKIIAWEVLDFFQFEADFTQDETIEKIRRIFDSELISKMKSNINSDQNVLTLSQILNISDLNLIGQYGMSKYNQNTTIKNMSEIQYGLQDSKKDYALHKLINDNVLNTEKNILDFMSLQQSETHSSKFKGYNLVHHLPLSLLLFYADEEEEYSRIAAVLKKTGNLEMMFLSSVKAGEMIIEHFGVYIKKKFKNETKDQNKYTMANLQTFITGIEKQVSKNRTVKDLSGLKSQMNGKQLNLSFSSGISNTKMSLTKTTQAEQIQVVTKTTQAEQIQVVTKKTQNIEIQPAQIEVIEKVIDPKVQIISDTLKEKEISNLTDQEELTIKRESIQTDLKDQVLEMNTTKKSSQPNFQVTNATLTKDLDKLNELSSIQSQKDEIIDMQNQGSRIAVISKTEFKTTQPNQSDTIQNNITVQKHTEVRVTIKRNKKDQIAVKAKTPNLFFMDDRRLI